MCYVNKNWIYYKLKVANYWSLFCLSLVFLFTYVIIQTCLSLEKGILSSATSLIPGN